MRQRPSILRSLDRQAKLEKIARLPLVVRPLAPHHRDGERDVLARDDVELDDVECVRRLVPLEEEIPRVRRYSSRPRERIGGGTSNITISGSWSARMAS